MFSRKIFLKLINASKRMFSGFIKASKKMLSGLIKKILKFTCLALTFIAKAMLNELTSLLGNYITKQLVDLKQPLYVTC